jgi:signal transduction histidine kinase
LNNLLGVVVGYLDLFKNGHDCPDTVTRSVGLMDHAITRIVNIIGKLSTIANNDRYDLAELSVPELIESCIVRFKEEYEVDAEVSDTLFEPFITTKTSVGRGMGLTIARHTIRKLEGDIHLKANAEIGATALLTYPL